MDCEKTIETNYVYDGIPLAFAVRTATIDGVERIIRLTIKSGLTYSLLPGEIESLRRFLNEHFSDGKFKE